MAYPAYLWYNIRYKKNVRFDMYLDGCGHKSLHISRESVLFFRLCLHMS